jgi:hypothetical protein
MQRGANLVAGLAGRCIELALVALVGEKFRAEVRSSEAAAVDPFRIRADIAYPFPLHAVIRLLACVVLNRMV